MLKARGNDAYKKGDWDAAAVRQIDSPALRTAASPFFSLQQPPSWLCAGALHAGGRGGGRP